jgi:hypothetical protein
VYTYTHIERGRGGEEREGERARGREREREREGERARERERERESARARERARARASVLIYMASHILMQNAITTSFGKKKRGLVSDQYFFALHSCESFLYKHKKTSEKKKLLKR